MNYTKPDVAVLGEAAEVLTSIVGKPPGSPLEMPLSYTNPAYDLDE